MSKAPKEPPRDIHQSFIQSLRKNNTKTPRALTCPFCPEKPFFQSADDLWKHVETSHSSEIPKEEARIREFRQSLTSRSGPARRKRQAESSDSPLASVQVQTPRLPPDASAAESPRQLKALHLNDAAQKDKAKSDVHTHKKRGVGRSNSSQSSVSSAASEGPSVALKAPVAKQAAQLSRVAARGDGSSQQKHQASGSDFGPRAKVSSKALFDPKTSFPATRSSLNTQNSRHMPIHGPQRQPNTSPVTLASTAIVGQTQSSQMSSNQRGILPASALNIKAATQSLQSKRQSQHHKNVPRNRQPTPVEVLRRQKAADENTEGDDEEDDMRLILQPVTKPISQEQLIAEVKGIYAGLVMVEGKCVQVDAKQTQLVKEAPEGNPPKLSNEQYQALIALHRTLLHEHHDFFLASQHPSATPGARKLALKYAMPARLWKHGIHGFLELLRQRLPESIEHMLAFCYLAYSMMTLLLETVPAFEDTWVECLGDLARYRMAIVEREPDTPLDHDRGDPAARQAEDRRTMRRELNERERIVWTGVATEWYTRATISSPDVGRLYHHLAILAQGDVLKQLFYYGKALSVRKPFVATSESAMSIFRTAFGQREWHDSVPQAIRALLTLHATLFTRKRSQGLENALQSFTSELDSYIYILRNPEADTDFRQNPRGRQDSRSFFDDGYCIALCGVQSVMGYDSTSNPIVRALAPSPAIKNAEATENDLVVDDRLPEADVFEMAVQAFNEIAIAILGRIDDTEIFGYVHCTLVFLVYLADSTAAVDLLAFNFPWVSLASILNSLMQHVQSKHRDTILAAEFPISEDKTFRPLPEDFAMHALPMAAGLYPDNYFVNGNVDVSNRLRNEVSMDREDRPLRMLWLGRRLAKKLSNYLAIFRFDEQDCRFSVPRNEGPEGELTADSDIETDTIPTNDEMSLTTSISVIE